MFPIAPSRLFSRAVMAAALVLVTLPQAAFADRYRSSDRYSSDDYSDYDSGGSDFDYSYSGRYSDRRGGGTGPYALSIGSGIASPSASAFFGENPSGLIYNRKPSVLGFVATGPQRKDLVSNGLSFIAGNGWAAASLGIQSYNNSGDDAGNITTFNFGIAAYNEFLNMAFGLNGMYRLGGAAKGVNPGDVPTWTADLGILYNPFGRFRIGFNLYNLSQGVTAGALGFAGDVNRFATLTLDASTNNHGQGFTVKPGIGVRASHLHLAYSYGMQLDKNAVSGITAGNTIGIGYEFNSSFRLDGYYNQVVPYFLGATVSF